MPLSGLGMGCQKTQVGLVGVRSALDFLLQGGRLIDTAIINARRHADANLYQNIREIGVAIGEAIRRGIPRAEIFVTSKIPPDLWGYDRVQEVARRLLVELGLEYVDLLLLYEAGGEDLPCVRSGDNYQFCRHESWRALETMKTQGFVRALGVSNWGTRQIMELHSTGARVQVNQVEFHPWAPQINKDTVAWCHDQGIVVMAYGALATPQHASWVTDLDELKPIASHFGKTVAQVLLRWYVQQGVVVIPATTNFEHMRQNLDIFNFGLPDHIMEAIGSFNVFGAVSEMNFYGKLLDNYK